MSADASPNFSSVKCGVLFSFLILFYLFSSCYYPAPGGDEVIYSVTAHGLTLGRGFSRYAMPGPHHYEVFDHFPPIIHVLMAASYKVFGFGIWQTKFPSWIAASSAGALIFILVKRLTKKGWLAEKALAIFSLNSLVGNAFVSGRFESLYMVFMMLALFAAFVGAGASVAKKVPTLWLISGIATGLAIVSYYSYAPLSVAILLTLSFLLPRDPVHSRSLRRSAMIFSFLGLAMVCALFYALHLSHRVDLFQLQIGGQLDTYAGKSIGDLIASIRSEPRRYGAFMFRWLGFADLIFLIGAIGLMLRCGQKTARCMAVCCLLWLAFLAVYGTKGPQSLSPVYLFAIIGFSISWDESTSQKKVIDRLASKMICGGVICFGLLRVALIAFTILWQWEARNYSDVEAQIHAHVPSSAKIAAPQTAWYALAGRVSRIHLYCQDFSRIGVQNGAASLNDPAYLKDFSHVILASTAIQQPGLEPFVKMTRSNYVLVYQRKKPFKKLPWTSEDPYFMEIYERKISSKEPS